MSRSQPRARGAGAELRAQVLPLYVPSFLFFGAVAGSLLGIPLYALEIGASPAQAAFISSLAQLGSMAVALPAGTLAARLSARISGLLGAAMFAAAIVGAALSRTVLPFAICVFLVGAARAVWDVSRHAYNRYAVPRHARGRVLATLGGVHRLAQLLGPAAAGLIAVAVGLRGAFVAIAGLMLVAGAAAAILGSDAGMATGERAAERADTLRTVLAQQWRPLLRNGGPMMLLALIRNSRFLLLTLWGAHLGLATDAIGIAVSVSSGVDVLVFYFGGLISDRYGRRAGATLTLLTVSLALGLIPLATTYPLLLVIGGLMGLGNGLSAGAGMTMGVDLAPRGQSARFLALWRVVADVGGTGGPLLIGAAAQLVSLAAAGPLTAAVGLLGAALYVFVVKETGAGPRDG